MQFGKIEKFILFGGGQRLVNFIETAKGYSVVAVSAPRLIQTKLINGATVEEYLRQKGITFLNIERLEDFDADAYIDDKTLGISFGAPWIFKKDFIGKFNGRLINGHGARLPKNRGGATFSWQIMRADRTGCYLFHIVDEGVDTGAIVMKEEFVFPATCRTPNDYKDFYVQGEIVFFEKFLQALKAGDEFLRIVQDEEQGTYFPRLSALHHGWIDWSWSAQEIERFICAFDEPYEGASTLFDGKRVFLRGASLDMSEGVFHPFMSGLIFRMRPEYVAVVAPDGAVRIQDVYDESGRCLLSDIRIGSRFVTPAQYLENARAFKAVYTPRGLK